MAQEGARGGGRRGRHGWQAMAAAALLCSAPPPAAVAFLGPAARGARRGTASAGPAGPGPAPPRRSQGPAPARRGPRAAAATPWRALGAAAASAAAGAAASRRLRRLPAGALAGASGPLPPRGRSGPRARAADRDQESAMDLGGGVLELISETSKYIEEDRVYRRPVFAYSDWKRHRSSDRGFRNLRSALVSTTIRANVQEILSTTLVALLVCLWNDADIATGLDALKLDDSIVALAASRPALALPPVPFTLSSAFLSLLLVFRTNQAYGRWWEARCIWGSIINTCRDVVRQALSRFDPKDLELRAEVTRLVAAYPRCLIYHLGERTEISDAVLEKKLGKILEASEKAKLLGCTHKPMTVCGMISDAIRKGRRDPVDEMKLDGDITKFSDYYGMCERIFKTPMPLSVTRLTSRFLSVWLLAMPMALYSAITPHWIIIPVAAVLSIFIFGVEELGIQLEEPFSALPLNAMADGIDASIFEALELDREERA